jgi:glutamate dehydrogenase/leucine dehydrogenase
MHNLQFDMAAERLNLEPWIAVKEKVNMRTAAYMLALGKVGEAKRLRGIFP